MSFAKIPFALNAAQEMVDAHSIERGKRCGCICPSCKTPLVARQGTEKAWHFAHYTRGTHARTAQQCEFAFYVSVRQMARQVMASGMDLYLPGCFGTLDRGQVQELRFAVSAANVVTVRNVRIEERVAGVLVDVLGDVESFPFAVYLKHPGRPIPESLSPAALVGQRVGVIAIDLGRLPPSVLFAASSYHAALANFLARDLPSKRWLYHPRYEQVKARVLSQRPTPAATASLDYWCVMCKLQWQAPSTMLPKCPACGEHLYVSIKGSPA